MDTGTAQIPDYAEGDIVIYNCDFRKYLKSRYPIGGVIVSDPPYNIDFKKYNQYKDNLPDAEYIDLISNFRGRPAVLVHYPEESMKYYLPAMGVPTKVCVWCYNSQTPRRVRNVNFLI